MDAINDITEIAQVSFGDIKADDTAETDYCELVEYVRLAILMIYQELNTPPTKSKKKPLH